MAGHVEHVLFARVIAKLKDFLARMTGEFGFAFGNLDRKQFVTITNVPTMAEAARPGGFARLVGQAWQIGAALAHKLLPFLPS